MGTNYTLVFDDVMVKQLKKAAKNQHIKEILTKMLDKLELSGPDAGELLDSQLSEFEMKTSPEKQEATIKKLKQKASSLKS